MSEAKKRRLLAAAEAEADEALALAGKRARLSEAQVAPDDLTGGCVCGVGVKDGLKGVMRWGSVVGGWGGLKAQVWSAGCLGVWVGVLGWLRGVHTGCRQGVD